MSSNIAHELAQRIDGLGLTAKVEQSIKLIAAGFPAPATSATGSARPLSHLEQVAQQLADISERLALAFADGEALSRGASQDLAGLVIQVQQLADKIAALKRPADTARLWRSRQPRRWHQRRGFVWKEHTKRAPGFDRNQRARLLARARWFNKLHRAKGEYGGPFGDAGLDIYEELLEEWHNERGGQCDPKLATIAEKTGWARSTVAEVVKRLSAAGLLTIVSRREIKLCRDGVVRPAVASNQYEFPARLAGCRMTEIRPAKPDSRFEISDSLAAYGAVAFADGYRSPAGDAPQQNTDPRA